MVYMTINSSITSTKFP